MGYAMLILAALSACAQTPAGMKDNPAFYPNAQPSSATVSELDMTALTNVQTLASGDLHFQ